MQAMAETNAVPIRRASNISFDMVLSSPSYCSVTAVGFRQSGEEQSCEEEDSDQDREGIDVLHRISFAISQKDSIM